MTEDLGAPFEASAIYLVAAIVLLVVLALWMGWRITSFGKPNAAPKQVRTWQRKIDELLATHREAGDERVYSLALAKLLRDFGTQQAGRDMTTLSVKEIGAVSGYREFSQLLGTLEQPSFSPDGDGQLDRITERAKAVVGAW